MNIYKGKRKLILNVVLGVLGIITGKCFQAQVPNPITMNLKINLKRNSKDMSS